MGAAIAQWIRLRLPSCHTGFKSQKFNLFFYQFIIVSCGKDENKRKRGRDWPNFYKTILYKKSARNEIKPRTSGVKSNCFAN